MEKKLTPAQQQLLTLIKDLELELMSDTYSRRNFWIKGSNISVNNNVARTLVFKCFDRHEAGNLAFKYTLKDEYKDGINN